MISFVCSHCGQELQVKDKMAGQPSQCSECGQSVTVPEPSLTKVGGGKQPPAPQVRSLKTSGIGPSSQPTGEEVYDFLAPPLAADEMGRFGDYRVLKVLGSGGMGVVFLAEDGKLKRRVALKAIKPSAASPDAKQRFLREAQATAQLKHDHVVTIYQVGEERGVPFLTMELLQGESLDDRLQREGKLPVPEALRIARETAEGLAAAHEAGLIHRDIKPANIWLESRVRRVESKEPERAESRESRAESQKQHQSSGSPLSTLRSPLFRVKILDFGLARGGAGDVQLTQSGVVAGTPTYMSPEQAAGRQLDGRSDLFSLGCVLYRILTGVLPFQGTDHLEVLVSLATEAPIPVRELNSTVPPAVEALILRLLAKQREERPASAASLIKELARLECDREDTGLIHSPAVEKRTASAGLDTASQVPSLPDRPLRGKTWLRSPLAWLIGAGAGLVLLLLALVLVVLYLVQSGKGSLALRSDQPGVEVIVEQYGKPVAVLDSRTRSTVDLKPGTYRLKLSETSKDLVLDAESITLGRGESKTVSAQRLRPPRKAHGPVIRTTHLLGKPLSKMVEFQNFRIYAPDEVQDEALWEAYYRVERMFGHCPQAVRNLLIHGVELRILGASTELAQLPFQLPWKGKFQGEFPAKTGVFRAGGGLFPCCNEENLLHLPGDRYPNRDICVHVMAHAVFRYGLPPELRRPISEQYQKSLARGLWQGTAAASSDEEFFAELSMWYFGSEGDAKGLTPKPAGMEGLRLYDPDAFALLDGIYSGRTPIPLYPLKPLPPQQPEREGILRSPNAASDAVIILFNNHSGEAVDLVWIDPQGKRQPYLTLTSQTNTTVSTRIGHVFLVIDSKRQAKMLFVAEADPGEAIIPAKP